MKHASIPRPFTTKTYAYQPPFATIIRLVTITFERITWTLTSDLIRIIITVLHSIAYIWWWHIACWWRFGIWEINVSQNIDKKYKNMSQIKMLVKMKFKRAKNSKNLSISTKLMTHRTLVKIW